MPQSNSVNAKSQQQRSNGRHVSRVSRLLPNKHRLLLSHMTAEQRKRRSKVCNARRKRRVFAETCLFCDETGPIWRLQNGEKELKYQSQPISIDPIPVWRLVSILSLSIPLAVRLQLGARKTGLWRLQTPNHTKGRWGGVAWTSSRNTRLRLKGLVTLLRLLLSSFFFNTAVCIILLGTHCHLGENRLVGSPPDLQGTHFRDVSPPDVSTWLAGFHSFSQIKTEYLLNGRRFSFYPSKVVKPYLIAVNKSVWIKVIYHETLEQTKVCLSNLHRIQAGSSAWFNHEYVVFVVVPKQLP